VQASVAAIFGLGFVLGLKHATDADHVVAVSTIVSEQKSVARASWVGVLWGFGHTAALLVAGLAIILLKLTIPSWVSHWLELAVAAMLVLLGANVLWKSVPVRLHRHAHRHHGEEHEHWHAHMGSAHPLLHDHPRTHRLSVGLRPFFVGIVHGVAGSASLMLLVLATIASPWVALGYIGVFGAGSIGGMLTLSWLIGLPFALTATRWERWNLSVRLLTGAVSCLFGLYLAWQIAASGRLL
jgi:ABC-type nickel/cobalt efflux system permease component RcnA